MIRTTTLAMLAVIAGAALTGCATPQPQPQGLGFDMPRNTNSPIAGATLHCARDYPDSRLVFGRDGTLTGRYAGRDVNGAWSALGTGEVEVQMQAGGIAVRDIMRRNGAGWHGQNTACG